MDRQRVGYSYAKLVDGDRRFLGLPAVWCGGMKVYGRSSFCFLLAVVCIS